MEQNNRKPVRYEFGMREDKIVHISEIPEEERGLNCNCTCPNCGDRLIARLGPVNEHCFAHENSECSTSAAKQTALHMLAKEIIEEHKKLLFPSIEIVRDGFITEVQNRRILSKIPFVLPYKKARVVACDTVTLEKRISNIMKL